MAKKEKPDLTITTRLGADGKTISEYQISSRWWWLIYFLGMCLAISGSSSRVNVSVDDKLVEVSG